MKEEKVTCKKCIGYIIKCENIPKLHLTVTKDGPEFLHFNTACHTVGGKETHFPEAVTCQKCLYIIKKSIRSCQ